RWIALGAKTGSLGCPTGSDHAIIGRSGRAMPFDRGEIVTSPEQGAGMVVAVYQQGADVVANWGDTAPYNYDFFIVRLDYEGNNLGQDDVKGGPRSAGSYAFHNGKQDDATTPIADDGPGRYSVT